MLSRFFKFAILFVYLAGLILPGLAFFNARGGLDILSVRDTKIFLSISFPLVGLYAFTLVTLQVLLATNLRWIQKFWPAAITLHRFQGIFALLFALLHPLFILLSFGFSNFVAKNFVAAELKGYVIFGQAALVLMLLTVTTAFLAWRGKNLPWWRSLHRLNYAVFFLGWIHSWFIGSDTRGGSLRNLWLFYLVAVTLSIFFKYKDKILPSRTEANN